LSPPVTTPALCSLSLHDALPIWPGRSVVLIGGGFIGLEIAASAAKLGASVTVLELAPRLMGRAMPPIVSDFARALHERHGVRLRSEEHTSELQSLAYLVCRLLLE